MLDHVRGFPYYTLHHAVLFVVAMISIFLRQGLDALRLYTLWIYQHNPTASIEDLILARGHRDRAFP